LRRRFLTSTMLIALTAIILLGVPLGFVLDRLAREATISRLERSAANIAVAVEPIVSDGRRPSRALLDQLTPPGDRTVLHLADGERIEAGDPPAEPSLSVETDAGAGAVVELIAPATPVIETVRRSIITLAAVAAVGLALAGVLATVQARRLTRPIEELARAAHRLGGGDFSARPPRSGVPELDALAETLDSSRERIAALVDAERQFAANASHQLRSALTGLTLRPRGARRLTRPRDEGRGRRGPRPGGPARRHHRRAAPPGPHGPHRGTADVRPGRPGPRARA
jgi:HAMP domain-containing protein